MLDLLIRLMVLAALAHLGVSIANVAECDSAACFVRVEKASRDLLRVNWKPISVFPEEGGRFR
jgi:hypothetical protein